MSDRKINARSRVILIAITLLALCGTVFAESVSSRTNATAATRLIALGYLSDGYTQEQFESAIRDFRVANHLPEGDSADEAFMLQLMRSDAISQYDYLAALADELKEMRPLTLGDTGEDVSRLQRNLSMYGYCDAEPGEEYDAITADAVRRFQLACGLTVTGTADSSVFLRLYDGAPDTYDGFLINQTCERGDSGDHVRSLQVWLRKLGATGFSVTGSYGILTARAVRAYQRSKGLNETGNADEATIRCITEDILQLSKQVPDYSPESNTNWSDIAMLLIAQGYEPDVTLNAQSQLALMKFQKDHAMQVTGLLDHATLAALNEETLPVSDDELFADTDISMMGTYAFDLIGTRFTFFSSYGLPEYVYLKFGSRLPEEDLAALEPIFTADEAAPGTVVRMTRDEDVLWGISLGDGGVVTLNNGLCVLYYPNQNDGITLKRLKR